MDGRRSPHLRPQIEATEEGAQMSRRRDGYSPAAAASLPDDEDMLREILLRLQPQPSSLPRASAVCRRWRALVTDPKFHRQFRVHHRKPPLLGFFEHTYKGIVFTPALDPPGRIPPQRFNLGRCSGRGDCNLLDCRHGLVLVKDCSSGEVVVCAPITGEQRRLAVPPEFKQDYFTGTVICAVVNQGHVHGGCHSSPFKVILVSTGRSENQPLGCVYSSETGEWGNPISTEAPSDTGRLCNPATLVGNVFYWLIRGDRILEFDLDRQNLAVTAGPPVTNGFIHGYRRTIKAGDGVVGAILAHPHPLFHMWHRNVSCQGVATWVPWKTIQMHNILGLSLQVGAEIRWLMGHDEDNDLIFLYASRDVYSVQLKSMHSEKLYETNRIYQFHLHQA